MISVKVGHPGEGKSSTTSKQIRSWVSKGIHVYTNLHLNEPSPYYHYFDTDDWEIIYHLQDGVIVFDEGQFILDAREWEKLPKSFRMLMQKGRHEGLDFIILTQNIMQIDVMARRLIHEARKVQKIISIKKFNFGIYIDWPIDVSGLEKEKITGLPVEGYVMMPEDWEYYNSHALRTVKDPPEHEKCVLCGMDHKVVKK